MEISQLHDIVFDKFVNKPYGHLLDYSGPLPTKNDCDSCFPNVTGWWTPIENGAFFTGIYLYALLDSEESIEKYRDDILTLKDGLLHLQDVAKIDGFIARGVGNDGECHYPYSSDDQLGPFLVGIWKYRNSVLCSDAERADIDSRILRIVDTAERSSWCYRNELNDSFHGGCNDKWWRSVAQKMFMLRIAYEIAKDEDREKAYRRNLSEHPSDSYISRLRVLENGFSTYMIREPAHAYYWIFTSSSLMHYELYCMETDPDVKCRLKNGLVRNGEIAIEFTKDFEKRPENQSELAFDPDWTKLRAGWLPVDKQEHPIAFASNQSREWAVLVPARRYEHTFLANSLFSAWICMKCTDKAIADAAFKNLCDNIAFTDWDALHLCYTFAAESAYISHK